MRQEFDAEIYRKHEGWAVRGTVAGEPFEGWIWPYVERFVMGIDDGVLERTGLAAGDVARIVVEPHPEPEHVAPYRVGGRR